MPTTVHPTPLTNPADGGGGASTSRPQSRTLEGDDDGFQPVTATRWERLRRQRWWPWLITAVSGAFVAFVGYLIWQQGSRVDWPTVWQSFRALPASVMWTAGALAWSSHLLYSTFDLFGRHYTRHGLTVPRTMGITLIAYPFTLNLGSLIGGVTTRYRLYSRQGVGVGQIGQIVGLSILTNWLGYFVLTAAVFWVWTPQLPVGWEIGASQLRWIGTGLAAFTVGYLALCVWRRGQALTVRGYDFPMPHWSTGLLQVALSTANWMVMGGALWLLTQQQAPYAASLATILLGAIAGLISRIPAGLGVLEAVGTTVLSAYMPPPQALAAVLAYRALYFFAPLAVAALAFGATEIWWRKRAATAPPPA